MIDPLHAPHQPGSQVPASAPAAAPRQLGHVGSPAHGTFVQPIARLTPRSVGQPLPVCVWAAPVAPLIAVVEASPALLSDDELARAGRFVQPHDRDIYRVAHTLLRALLALATSCPPRSLCWHRGPFGKPFLDGPTGDVAPAWQFNLSHTAGWVLLALARDVELGVDVETPRPHLDLPGIASRFFSSEEVAVWATVPPAQQTDAFYRLWTRKEAFMKAVGQGFGLPLDSFAIEADPVQPPRLLRVPPGLPGCGQWSVCDLSDPLAGLAGPAVPRAALVVATPSASPTLQLVSAPALTELLHGLTPLA